MVEVKIPATSANIGAGFDCLGLALGLYNYVWAEETDSGLNIEIKDESSDYLPTDERNLVYSSMMAVYTKVGVKPKGLHIILENNIPVTRGLGSSAAGIVGGLLAADALTGSNLDKHQLLNMASAIEGHPDNAAPAIFGGMTVNVTANNDIKGVKTELPDDLKFAAFIPDFFLATKKSRSVLPRKVSMRDAVFNTGRSALLVGSLMTRNYDNIRTAVDDRLHQKFRKKLIPHIDDVFKYAYRSGALGVYLSGAGPTVVAMVKADNTKFEKQMQEYLRKQLKNWQLHMLNADNVGAFARII